MNEILYSSDCSVFHFTFVAPQAPRTGVLSESVDLFLYSIFSFPSAMEISIHGQDMGSSSHPHRMLSLL